MEVLEKELALKDAKLSSMQHNLNNSTSGPGHDLTGPLGENHETKTSLENEVIGCFKQFSHDVCSLRTWLGDRGCAAYSSEARVCGACFRVPHALNVSSIIPRA